ncbi:MAG: LPS export ABC transporter permease LptG [Alphaproteobacteria bacterium]|nr:LPS export ABC transporter permease LptG [Alphaproteobacteria bacterium]
MSSQPWTLYRYLAWQLLLGAAFVFGAVATLTFMIDLVEMMREAAGKEEVGFFGAMTMSLMKLPSLTEKTLPFAMLFGAIFTFTRMSRSSELVVIRGSGLSVWQFLAPGLGLALLVGIVSITLYNPLAALMASSYEQMEARYLSGRPSLLAVSSSGLWLRQADSDGQSVIHAVKVAGQGLQLNGVIIFLFDGKGSFTGRIDAQSASLQNGYWLLQKAWQTVLDHKPAYHEQFRLPTTLTDAEIQESFASPETISFWELPHFISTAEAAGLSATRHRLHYFALLAQPFLLCAMTLIAATFSLRFARLGGLSSLILAGSFAGFLLYFITEATHALGLSGILPAGLAAWSPTAVALLLGAATLLHLEDG